MILKTNKIFFLCIIILLLFIFHPSYIHAAKTSHSKTSSKKIEITDIKYWSNPNYTRVVIRLSGNTVYKHRLLKEDSKIKKQRRFFIDIKNAVINPSLKKSILINDGLLKMARAGQYTKEIVRVVLDIESIQDYKIFSLEEPFRIVVDVMGKKQGAGGREQGAEETKLKTDQKTAPLPPPTLAQQLGLKIKRIVIDAGHGGKDPGAVGKGGLKEKDVVLKIAKGLKETLSKETEAEIVMTRDADRFIELEERTAIANTKEADIFISIHANASFNRLANGVETYYLNLTNDERAIRVAARENAVSMKKMSDLQYILLDLMKTAKTNESSRLAARVQDSLTAHLKTKYSNIKGNGVKGAPFYVLVGTHMPSILVEVSFISNPEEEARLRDDAYIKEIVNGVTNGVARYVKEMDVASE